MVSWKAEFNISSMNTAMMPQQGEFSLFYFASWGWLSCSAETSVFYINFRYFYKMVITMTRQEKQYITL